MNTRFRPAPLLLAAATLIVTGTAFAQSSALTAPNNSAGTPLDTPPLITRPAAEGGLPTRTESSITAFDKLDLSRDGTISRAEAAGLPGNMSFFEADRNRDGRLDADEFQRFWGDYLGAGQ